MVINLLNFVMVVHFKIARVTVRIWMYDREERMNTSWFLSQIQNVKLERTFRV